MRALLCVQATSALGDHTMMIMDTPLPDSDGKLSAPLMIWATGRDPLTIYTRLRLSSYIWRVLWKAAAMGNRTILYVVLLLL